MGGGVGGGVHRQKRGDRGVEKGGRGRKKKEEGFDRSIVERSAGEERKPKT